VFSCGSCLTELLAQTSDPAGGWIGAWSPGIGDPTFVGWITVFAYLLASYLCWRVFRQFRLSDPAGNRPLTTGYAVPVTVFLVALAGAKRHTSRLPLPVRLAALWLAVGVALLLLGINKQLDLQTALTEIGRMMARDEGWYARRARVQLVFIVLVVLTGAWGLRAILLLAHGGLRSVRGVLIGMVFLVCFVAIRASSFHHVDNLLGYHLGGFKMNWLLELGGISFVGVNAYRNIRRPPPRPTGVPPRQRRAPPTGTGTR
jgi:hypothetical protein